MGRRTPSLGRAVLGLVVALFASSCAGGPSPSARHCDGVTEEAGGCTLSRTDFSGTTCTGVATEWGKVVDRRVLAVLAGPAVEGGKARSVRISDVLVVASVRAAQHLRDIGLLESCDLPEFLPVAKAQLSEELQAKILGALYDGNPVAAVADWDGAVAQAIATIDTDDQH
jgi:hypothetical protein